MATTKKPAPASKSRALVPWEQEMAAAAQKQASHEKPVGLNKSISTRGGILMIDETPVPGNELDVVVIAAIHENQYYDGPFDPNTPQAPACYSFGDPEAEDPEGSMAPHEKAKNPQGDSNGLCANCELNQMGSADTGRGKACKNVRRLAVVTADALESAEDLDVAEVRVLKVPVMSVKGWASYVRGKLAEEINRPAWGVVTKIKLVPDAKSQFKVTFQFAELVNFDQALYDSLQRKIKEVTPNLMAPYPELEDAPPPPTRGRGAARQQPVAQPLRPAGRAVQAMAKQQPAAKKVAAKTAPAAPAGKRAKY